MKKIMSVVILMVLAGSVSLFGQMKIGMDIYTRYIWRGIDFGNAPSYQPAISYTAGDLSFGAWGAFNTTGTYSENDLWASYAFTTSAGTFTVYYSDYYFPLAGIKFLNYEGKGNGAHTLEGGLGYTGTESLPITAAVFANFYNDVDNSTYVQISYPFTIDSVYSLTVFAGGSLSKSIWYASAKAGIINVGITVTKTIVVTESFSLPVSALYIINPEIEQSYLIFGISL